MFSSVLIALVASAVSVSASKSLSLKVSGPAHVDGVNNFQVVTTLTNTGDETLKLLNDPRGVLNQLPTHAFAITNEQGTSPAFNGVRAKYVPSAVVKANDPSAFTVLAPGKSVDVSHDLSTVYNFTQSGAGDYKFEASNLFHFVDDASNVVPIRADNTVSQMKVSGVLSKARNTLSSVSKRATFDGCSDDQQSQINEAVPAAGTYASDANSYAAGLSAATDRYSTWFGAWDDGRAGTVKDHFSKISSNDFSSFTFNCSCTDAGTYAYVYPDQFGTITFCGAYWNAPTTGTDSKAGTIIHESSHFTNNGGTADNVYGQDGAKQLAQSDPGKAVMNADSHEYFAENNPAQS